MMDEPGNRWLASSGRRGDDYDSTYEARAALGEEVHGEANFVESFAPRSVLDAGCGTGRVGRELARRGLDVAGVDIDPRMLATARRKAPEVDWQLGDLATITLGRCFDAAVLAGNVMLFLTPGTEAAVVANVVQHVHRGGCVIAGFQLVAGRLTVTRYDELAAAAGLEFVERWATWERNPWKPGGDYAVSVHRSRQEKG